MNANIATLEVHSVYLVEPNGMEVDRRDKKCRICPAGMYCDPNNMYQSPRPCPKGTFETTKHYRERIVQNAQPNLEIGRALIAKANVKHVNLDRQVNLEGMELFFDTKRNTLLTHIN